MTLRNDDLYRRGVFSFYLNRGGGGESTFPYMIIPKIVTS